MKKILLFIALFCTVGLVRADEILTAQPGAYYRVEVQQGTQRALGSPFQYFSSSLEEIFKNQLVGAPQDANATKVIKWVNSSQSYLQAFLADGTGDTSKDKKYFNNSSDWVPTTLTLSQGEGFFLQAPQTLTVYITGKIVLDSTVSVTFAPQFTLFSLPFSSCQGINSTSFGPVANGAATEADSPDVISTINPAQSFWLCNPGDSSAPEYLKWMDASAGTISSQTLLPTEAYWFQRQLSTSFTLTETRPYDNPFSSACPVQITNMEVNAALDAVTLTLSNTDVDATKTIEIYYKDIDPASPLNLTTGWSLAAKDIPATATISWIDNGLSSSAAVFPLSARSQISSGSSVRLYTAGIKIDTDGDTLSDNFELLSSSTDPSKLDTESDGMDDFFECKFGLNPNLNDADGDLDQDNLTNLQEYQLGTDPANSTLPVPMNVKLVQATYGKVIISWDAVDNPSVTGYKILRNDVEVSSTTGTSYTDTNSLVKNTAYTYKVRSYSDTAQSDPSIALSVKTLDSCPHEDASTIEPAVDDSDGQQTLASSLISSVQSVFSAMGYSDTSFTKIDSDILSTLIQEQLDLVNEEETTTPTAEEEAEYQQEIDNVLDTVCPGHSFQDFYTFSKLIELGDMHWQAGKIDAAEDLYEEALKIIDDAEGLVYNSLWQMGRFKMMGLTDESTDQEIIDALAAHNSTLMRFFTYFPNSDSHLATMAHVAVTHANFKYFPTLLAYTDYSTTVYNNALQAAQSANTLSPSTMNAYRKERIETWELVPMTINFLKSDSTQLTGTVTLKNVSPTSVYPEDPVEDERTFTISSGSVSAPIYKGHSYEITASFDVTGGQPLVYKVQTLPREKGKKLTYDYFQTPALTDLADPNADAELVFINGQPDAPYNLAADVLAETFTLSWEWVAPSGFQLQHFKVYRGGVEIATTTDQSLQGILVESDNMTYTYTVKAFDVNNNPTPDSRSIEVLPEMTEDLQNYYAWKTQYFGTDPYYDYQDYDGDGLTNYQEYLLGSNPTLAFSENVKSTMSNISPGLHATYYQGDTTTDRISKFLALTPVGTDIVTTFNFAYSANPILTSGLSDYVCAKLEGYLDVPADGQYRFYLTSADGSILYIDDQLAINNDYRHSMREYTKDLYLKAGVHKIRIDFFEYDYSAGLSIEWAGPTFFRREITSSDVWYAPEMSEELEEALAWIVDNDQDGLCNNVEIVHNTDKDNADSDGDGLSDYDEIFTYQTNPNEADSDGDGVSDLVEVTVNFTDPNVANATATYTTVSSVSGSAATISTGEWQTSGSSIYALSRNGILEYTLSISPSGVYRLELEGTQHNALTSQDDFEIQLYIDGSYCGQQTLTAPYGTNGTAHFFLPSLPVGDHTAKIIWKNIASETFLQINALRLQSITGTDSDSNGVADWVDSRLENMSKVELASTSKTSPVCAEGDNAQNLELMAISGYYTQSGETPVEPPVMHGANNKWFADVPISPDGTTNLTFSFQNGAETVQKTVTWLPTNAITDDDMTIRLNDSLRLTGYPTGNSAGTVSITVDGQTYNTAANTPVVHKFETAGTFTVNATFTPDGGGDPVTGQMDVKVVSSSFSGGATCYLNVARVWENPDLADESVLEADSHISFFAGDMDPTGKELDLLIKESKTGYIVARLGEDGPVMAATTVTPLVAKIPTGHFTIIDEFDDGSQLVECAIYVSEVPDDLRIYLRIFVAGITFDDGTIERWVTADDFDENGVYRYLFIRAEGAYTGNCHYIKFYQGDDYLNKYF